MRIPYINKYTPRKEIKQSGSNSGHFYFHVFYYQNKKETNRCKCSNKSSEYLYSLNGSRLKFAQRSVNYEEHWPEKIHTFFFIKVKFNN
jgi:hypothetical protein